MVMMATIDSLPYMSWRKADFFGEWYEKDEPLTCLGVPLSNINVINTKCYQCKDKYGYHDVEDCSLYWWLQWRAKVKGGFTS